MMPEPDLRESGASDTTRSSRRSRPNGWLSDGFGGRLSRPLWGRYDGLYDLRSGPVTAQAAAGVVPPRSGAAFQTRGDDTHEQAIAGNAVAARSVSADVRSAPPPGQFKRRAISHQRARCSAAPDVRRSRRVKPVCDRRLDANNPFDTTIVLGIVHHDHRQAAFPLTGQWCPAARPLQRPFGPFSSGLLGRTSSLGRCRLTISPRRRAQIIPRRRPPPGLVSKMLLRAVPECAAQPCWSARVQAVIARDHTDEAISVSARRSLTVPVAIQSRRAPDFGPSRATSVESPLPSTSRRCRARAGVTRFPELIVCSEAGRFNGYPGFRADTNISAGSAPRAMRPAPSGTRAGRQDQPHPARLGVDRNVFIPG